MKSSKRTLIFTACIATILATTSLASTVPSQGQIDSRTLYFSAEHANTRTLDNLAADPPAAFDADRFYVLQVDGPMTPDLRDELLSVGVEIGQYLPSFAFIVRLGDVNPAEIAAMDSVRWIGVFRSDWKIAPALTVVGPMPVLMSLEKDYRTTLLRQGKIQATVILFDDGDMETIKDRLTQSADGEITAEFTDSSVAIGGARATIDVVIPTSKITEIAEWPEVQFIEEAPLLSIRNDTTNWIIQSNVSNYTPVWDRGLCGEGMIGHVIDQPLDEEHCAFYDEDNDIGPDHRKIIAYNGDVNATARSHGTHTSGTMAGKQVGGDSRDGMAYDAKMVFTDVGPIGISSPSSLNTTFIAAHNYGARVHSNSWGADFRTDYNNWSMQVDKFSYQREDSLVAFAITNRSELYTPENAKNVLAVGASQDTPIQNVHCSGGTGPTADGRRKPEVYAPGCSTVSSKPGQCEYGGLTGTSMACPAVAGMALLTRQYFVDGFYPTGEATLSDSIIPTGALMRAVLINSAVDMDAIPGYPSDLEGWGRVLLDNSLYFDGDTRKLVMRDIRNPYGLSTGESETLYIDVESSNEPLRFTLVWTDPPASVGTAFAAINNLDLSVESPDGTLYYGNVFDQGESASGGSTDDRNNIEQVHLLSPPTGQYAVTISATAVNISTQGYAIVITGDARAGRKPGDRNGDNNVDLDDFDSLPGCLSGPIGGIEFIAPDEECLYSFDFDGDDDVDLEDLAVFTAKFEEQN